MRRRPPPPTPAPLLEGPPPAEFRVGRCIEVWSVGGTATWRRYGRARHKWAKALGLSSAEEGRLLPPGGLPWSVVYLCAQGRGYEADARLERAGVRRDDLPALRTAAQARVADEPDFRLR